MQQRLWRMDDQLAHQARVEVMLAHGTDLQDRVAAMAVRDPSCRDRHPLLEAPTHRSSSEDGMLSGGLQRALLPLPEANIVAAGRRLTRARSLPSAIESALALSEWEGMLLVLLFGLLKMSSPSCWHHMKAQLLLMEAANS